MSEKEDIVERLKEADRYNARHYVRDPLHQEAVAEIVRIRGVLHDLNIACAEWKRRAFGLQNMPGDAP